MARTTSTETAPPRWREVFAGARGRLTAGLLILEALVAVEIMVVATILPAVQEELHGLQLYGWNYTALTLASFGAVPIAGKLTDRLGPRKVFGVAIGFYVIGLVLAASAPSMLVLVFARFVQGIGGGGLYVVSLSTVAKTYPERIRPRVMALLASMWILPGLLGPPVGAVLAETVGWRWAFLAPLPLIVLAAAMVMPSLRKVSVSKERSKLPVAASLVLMLGAGALLAGLTDISVWSIPLVVAGTAVTIAAVRRSTPPGTLTARPGLPAASAAAFLASAAFDSVNGFVTLMLTEVRGLSIGVAGIVITASALAWAAGSWWQSRMSERLGARRLAALGAMLIGAGSALVAAGLLDVPVIVPYVGQAVSSMGMGIVFPTIPLSVMGEVEEGREAGELSSTILMDYLGIGIGAGLGGASVALADAGTISIEAGLAGAFGIGILASALLVLVARRLPDARPVQPEPRPAS
jgi:MFS family permease